MKTKNIFTTIAVGIFLLAHALAIDVPPSKLAWPPGAEAIIDKAIAIKVEAQKKSMLMETEGWAAGHSFAKFMDELAAVLAKSPEMRTTLEKEEGNDLKAKIALWALDRQARPDEYARFEHVHITDNPLGQVAEKRRVEALEAIEKSRVEALRQAGPPLPGTNPPRQPRPARISVPPVASTDAVEANRWILEYFYFAPPRGSVFMRGGGYAMSAALGKVGNEKSLDLLRFNLENQIEAFPNLTLRDLNWEQFGAGISELLDFKSPRAFSAAASMMRHPVLKERLRLRLVKYQGWIYDAEHARLKAELEAMKRLAEMEWQTDAEKELAGWIKAIPPIPARPPLPERFKP